MKYRAFGGAPATGNVDWYNIGEPKHEGDERMHWLNGRWTWVRESGPKESPITILFAHRLLLDNHQWDAQVAAFNKKYRCVQIDWRRHGKSEEKYPYLYRHTSRWDLGEDLRVLIMDYYNSPCVIVGDEIGGIAAQCTAWQMGNDPRVKGMFLINTPMGHFNPTVRKEILTFLEQWKKHGGSQSFLTSLARHLFGANNLDKPPVQEYVKKFAKLDPSEIFDLVEDCVQRAMTRGPENLVVNNWQTNVPTYWLRCNIDETISKEEWKLAIESGFYEWNATHYVDISGDSRVPAITEPEVINRELAFFLKSLEQKPDTNNKEPPVTVYTVGQKQKLEMYQ